MVPHTIRLKRNQPRENVPSMIVAAAGPRLSFEVALETRNGLQVGPKAHVEGVAD
jgi:hypothetical protein